MKSDYYYCKLVLLDLYIRIRDFEVHDLDIYACVYSIHTVHNVYSMHTLYNAYGMYTVHCTLYTVQNVQCYPVSCVCVSPRLRYAPFHLTVKITRTISYILTLVNIINP